MGKILFWAILILAALIVARIASARNAAQRHRPPATQPRDGGDQGTETMVRCAHCGVHLPRSEALLLGGQFWCGEEHARLGGAQ